MDILARIKRLILTRRYEFTDKARNQMFQTDVTEGEVLESIVNAPGIHKVLRSRSAARRKRRERLYVILGLTSRGILVYTKGTIRRELAGERFYVLISAKRSVYWE